MIIDKEDPAFNAMQNIKRRMFALRNGVIADTLRRAGDPHSIIFGLTIIQIKELAEISGTDNALADLLWANHTTRESRLLAPFLYDKSSISLDKALTLAKEVKSTEEADILCQRLLRSLPLATEIIDKLSNDENDLQRYVALRLAFNLVAQEPEIALNVARTEQARNCALTKRVSAQLLQELDYLKPKA